MNRNSSSSFKRIVWLVPVALFGIVACGTWELDFGPSATAHLAAAGPIATFTTESSGEKSHSEQQATPTPHSVKEPRQTPTSVLDGRHLSFADPALGLSMSIPFWWETRTTPGKATQFLQQDQTGTLVPALTITPLSPDANTLDAAFEESLRGAWGPAIRGARPAQLGVFDALRVDLDPGSDRPPVFWLIVTPSGQAVSLKPSSNVDWIEAMVEVALDTLQSIDVVRLDVLPRAESTPTITAGSMLKLYEPLLVDGEKGWIFASAQTESRSVTVQLSTQEGHLLAAYDVAGELALDRTGKRLIVDQGENGVAVLDAATGATLGTVQLPIAGKALARPQVDPKTSLVYVFRGRTVLVIDPATAVVTRNLTLSVPSETCGEPGADADIQRSFFDLVNQKLYLAFTTYVCTPWVHQTLVAFDADTLDELGRYKVELRFQAIPFSDSLYGTTVSRLGRYISWAWNGERAWFEEGSDGTPRTQGIVGDWKRQLIYEAHDGQIAIITPYPRKIIGQSQVPVLADGARLVGHDPVTDHLFILHDGQLLVQPTTDILPPALRSADDSLP